MSSKSMLMGAASALLVSFACGCAAETGSDEGTSADEKTATEQSAIVRGNGYGNGPDDGYGNGDGNRYDPRATWGRGDGDYGRGSPPGYGPNARHDRRGAGRGYGGDANGRRYNSPPGNYNSPGYDYNQPGYGWYGPAYNSPGYQPGTY